MMIQLDKYAYYSGLKDVHPVEKACFMLGFLLFSIVTQNPFIALTTFLVMSLSIVIRGKIPVKIYGKLLLLPLFFLLTSVVAIVISFTSINNNVVDPIWVYEVGIWQIYISSTSINQALTISGTAIASVSCMYFLILTTPIQELIWLLQKVKVPSLFIELVLFTYRFIFVLLDKTKEIYIAQSSRLGYYNTKVSFFSLGHLVLSLFIKSMRTAKEVQVALNSRGGEDGLFDIELSHKYNSLHWIGIVISFVVLFSIYMVT